MQRSDLINGEEELSAPYSELASVAAIATVYGLIFGALYKLSDFVLKLRDVEIQSIRSDYQKIVVTSRLNERKQDAEWLEHLTNELNIPRDLKYELEFAERYGKYCIYLAVAVSCFGEAMCLEQ